LVTIVGSFPGINPGEILELLGEWNNHPKFGTQFKAVKFKSVMPATIREVRVFLQGHGVSSTYAVKIYMRWFGNHSLFEIRRQRVAAIEIQLYLV
jgi:hypothetical protein